jgi:murein DD-endopeptidase MepM/ murein hydrolase activator NlpD
MSLPIVPPSAYAGNIESLRGRKDPEAVKAAARELEALFAHEMVKAMRRTTGGASESGLGKDMYMSMFDMELSRLLAAKGLGLQDMIVRSMNRIQEKQTAATAPPQGQAIPSASAGTVPVAPAATLPSSPETVAPVDGKITSTFGARRHPIDRKLNFHRGIDIAAPAGTEIHPVRRGTVVFSGSKQGYGNVVTIDHGEGLTSTYAHNQSNMVKAGDVVETDTVIATVGSTGKSTGPHLHFEVRYRGRSVNPKSVMEAS